MRGHVGLDAPTLNIDDFFELNDPRILIGCTTSGTRVETAAQMAEACRLFAVEEKMAQKKKKQASAMLSGSKKAATTSKPFSSNLAIKPGRKTKRMSLSTAILEDDAPMSPNSELFDPLRDDHFNASTILDALNFDAGQTGATAPEQRATAQIDPVSILAKNNV